MFIFCAVIVCMSTMGGILNERQNIYDSLRSIYSDTVRMFFCGLWFVLMEAIDGGSI